MSVRKKPTPCRLVYSSPTRLRRCLKPKQNTSPTQISLLKNPPPTHFLDKNSIHKPPQSLPKTHTGVKTFLLVPQRYSNTSRIYLDPDLGIYGCFFEGFFLYFTASASSTSKHARTTQPNNPHIKRTMNFFEVLSPFDIKEVVCLPSSMQCFIPAHLCQHFPPHLIIFPTTLPFMINIKEAQDTSGDPTRETGSLPPSDQDSEDDRQFPHQKYSHRSSVYQFYH
ncbi:hypothetical protein O181_000989 [Austropuccinia psidii MF-1]|uniref:Uncharacterized protein n=1 Tax=Austropuccinia psidii MF-1 TaxID=1389203 RepID=A0A9Q3GBF1_9BASI|nr:hypothetical protein [Austropuccinia psidii MF-1]